MRRSLRRIYRLAHFMSCTFAKNKFRSKLPCAVLHCRLYHFFPFTSRYRNSSDDCAICRWSLWEQKMCAHLARPHFQILRSIDNCDDWWWLAMMECSVILKRLISIYCKIFFLVELFFFSFSFYSQRVPGRSPNKLLIKLPLLNPYAGGFHLFYSVFCWSCLIVRWHY